LDGLTTTIALWHPTTQKMDVTRPMTPLGNGRYRASLPLGQLGNWNLRIIAGDLTTQKYSHQERIFLKP
ncbi:MAG: FixH family protein, partial [Parvibaculaceae bacterium]|nr:FixH family protein [Parvibaculaceae bacterium]